MNSFIGTTLSGGLSGGLASVFGGGNFWDGFRNGAISAGLNHHLHKLQEIRPRKIDFSKKTKDIMKQVTKWGRFIRKNPDVDVYLSDIVKEYSPEMSFFEKVVSMGGGSRVKSEISISNSTGQVTIGYLTDYMNDYRLNGNTHITEIRGIWFKGNIGGSRYDIGFVGNSVNGNPPTLLYLNFYGKSFYDNIKSEILK